MYFCIRFNVLTIILADAKYKNKNEMDTLYLLQFACFLLMLVNILILGITRLHMKWMNRRYEVSRWLIIGAMVGLAIQFLMQMLLGSRRCSGSRFQHSGLSPLLLAHLYWHLQYRGNAC